MDFLNSFENWSLRDHLKIEFLGIKCKNENLEIKFEKDIGILKNYLKVRGF